ncbi:hypothetical protein A2U01_0081773, partial [Trifolium medium]|nr:hypothetical protein [Trifolium medium]
NTNRIIWEAPGQCGISEPQLKEEVLMV